MRARTRAAELATVAACHAIVVALLLHQSLFGGLVLTQADALLAFEPWRSVAPAGYVAENALLLDQARGFLPWNDFVAAELRRGELPLWCPYNYAGIPLVGTYQSAVYWPLNWIFYAWPSWHSYAWIALLRLVATGSFTFLWLRKIGVGRGAAGVGGLGFMLSGFMVAWLNHPHANVAMLLPALLWSVERAAARPSWREAGLFGLLFGLQLLGGHAQTSLHVALFVGCYAAWRVATRVRGHRLALREGAGRLAVGAALGLLLAAPQIVPFLDYVAHSQAAASFDRSDLVAGVDLADAAVLMVAPDHHGAPHTHDYDGPLGPNLNYNELIGGYVGRLLLVLALVGLAAGWRRGPRAIVAFLGLAVALAALVAWQVEPFHGAARALPLLSSTKLMRLLLFVAFGLSALGALGLDALLRRIHASRHAVLAASLAFVVVAGELVAFAYGYNPEVEPELVVPRTRTTDFLQRDRTPHRVLAVDNSVLAPNANVFHRIPMLSGYDSIEDRALTELLLRCTTEPPQYPFVSQIGVWNRIEALPLLSLLGVKYVLASGTLPRPFRVVHEAELTIHENPRALPKAFLARDLRLVTDPDERVRLMTAADFDPRVAIVHEPALAERLAGSGPSAAQPGTAEVVRYEPRELEIAVRSAGTGLLVVTDLYDAGWSAELRSGGVERTLPIERVDHALRGVVVPPGESTVVMRYDPWTTSAALAAAALALALLALLGVVGRGANRWRRLGNAAS